MPLLVHLTPEKNAKSVRRSGIKKGSAGVHCLPASLGFYASHQWLRELKRGGQRTIVAVRFRVGSEEPVSVGHFNKPHGDMTLGEAIGAIRGASSPLGWEIVIPRAILAREVVDVRSAPQVVGWRYFPESHGKVPTCDCPLCLPRGMIKSRKLRERLRRD